ncbi:MAG TPA: heme o synthase [Candidatus Saccharimonadales bacterium]|nr:heme o synthase [Candidatus Saccharimonadales bacterium]
MRPYLELTKPERTFANVFTAAAGFLLVTPWWPNWTLLLATLGGITLVIASACAANNYFDRELDNRMARTRQRALPQQAVTPHSAAWLTIILATAGFVVLALWVNVLVVLLGAIAYIDYVVLYGWSKRHSVWSTWIGTVSGSLSLVAGYCAVTDRFDRVALLLLVIMVFWQMAHFYAIGIYRLADYRAAKLPIWPARYGLNSTRWQIISFIIIFALATAALSLIGQTGIIFLIALLGLSLNWLRLALQPWRPKKEATWARAVFVNSLLVITALPVLLALGPHLP